MEILAFWVQWCLPQRSTVYVCPSDQNRVKIRTCPGKDTCGKCPGEVVVSRSDKAYSQAWSQLQNNLARYQGCESQIKFNPSTTSEFNDKGRLWACSSMHCISYCLINQEHHKVQRVLNCSHTALQHSQQRHLSCPEIHVGILSHAEYVKFCNNCIKTFWSAQLLWTWPFSPTNCL